MDLDAQIANCLNCLRKGSLCAAHKVIDRLCGDCGRTYRGTERHQRCLQCAADRQRKYYNGGERRTLPKFTKVCGECGAEFVGHKSSLMCGSCRLVKKRLAACGVNKGFRPVKPTKPSGPATPPACRRCYYFRPEPAYPSGMICLAEAFLRCSPWAPGAQPLKERQDAN